MGEFNINKSDGSLEQTAGMPSEYPATQVMLSDGVTSVEDALDSLTANTFGTVVDIKTYTASNPYVCPKDGYLQLSVSGSDGAISFGVTDGSNTVAYIVAASSQPKSQMLFVKKGLRLYVQTETGTTYAKFIPFD